MNILEVKDIVKNYANHCALDQVSLEVKSGVAFGLLGPNGAGKTSLIRIINQITAPDSGEVLFNGAKLHPDHISQIGYLPEERGLYKKMKVGEQALYLAQLKGLSKFEAEKRLKHWFEKFEIQAWWNRKVEELSKGMQQKIQFVVTVLHEPKLLIFDEPFSGFDPINVQILKNEMMELKKKGCTLIFSTHNMSSVEEVCDDIVLINKSKNILSGSVEGIKKQYKSHSFELSLSGLSSIDGILKGDYEVIENKGNEDFRKILLKMTKENSPNDLLRDLMPHCQIVEFREILPSMNDIFIQTVAEYNQSMR